MPVRIEHHPDFIRLTMSGTITQEDLVDAARLTASVEDSTSVIPNRLVDLTGIDVMDIGYQEVQVLAEVRRKRQFPNEFKSALVVATDVQKGYARMFQTLNDNPRIRLRIFTDIAAAEEWIRPLK